MSVIVTLTGSTCVMGESPSTRITSCEGPHSCVVMFSSPPPESDAPMEQAIIGVPPLKRSLRSVREPVCRLRKVPEKRKDTLAPHQEVAREVDSEEGLDHLPRRRNLEELALIVALVGKSLEDILLVIIME